MNSWLWLILAIVFEVMGTLSLKASAISSKVYTIILPMILYFISFIFLGITLKKLEVGIAYAVWSGIGTILITILGIMIFGESFSFAKVFFILLIVVGAIGLNLLKIAP